MSAPGEEIGLARVYDFALESGAYNTSNANINEWDISLYDIQTFTKITLNANHTLSTPTSGDPRTRFNLKDAPVLYVMA